MHQPPPLVSVLLATLTALLVGSPAAAPPAFPTLTIGEVLLQPNFKAGPPAGWQYVAGNQWCLLDGRFGDISDSDGPTGDGNWAAAGDPTWTDVRVSAD